MIFCFGGGSCILLVARLVVGLVVVTSVGIPVIVVIVCSLSKFRELRL